MTYVPYTQKPFDFATIGVRVASDPTSYPPAVALAACYLPARRASRVDPGITLRDE